MNVKKIIILFLVGAITLSFSACGKKDNSKANSDSTPTVTANATASAQTDASQSSEPKAESGQKSQTASTPLPPSTNQTVVKDEEAPKVYWATVDRDSSDVAYHLKDCPIIKDKSPAEISWEMIKSIGFRQCPVCNPPKYEGYHD